MKQIISEYKTEEKKSIKKLLIPLFTILLIGSVFAVGIGYLVNSLTLTIGVAEPFEVQYAVIGDAGTYTTGTCSDESLTWFTSTSESIPTGNFYPNEARLVCVRINNLGEVAIPYTISSVVTNDNLNNDCANAFGLPETLLGSALNGVNYNGKMVQIAPDAIPIQGCNVVISVLRG